MKNSVFAIYRLLTCFLLAVSLVLTSCESDEPGVEIAEENPDEVALTGGTLTQATGFTSSILTQYPPALFGQFDLEKHHEGNDVFNQTYVPPSAPVHSGLGPVYIASACFRCHINNGRGAPVGEPGIQPSMMAAISRPGIDPQGGPDSVPGFGIVLQTNAIINKPTEGELRITYVPLSRSYGDGESYSLRQPTHSIRRTPSYIDIPQGMLHSFRIATPLIGLGLLENIPEAMILEYEDPNDNNGDGISGRANRVHNVFTNSEALGRFGWKAGIATIHERVAFDFSQAMGVTSSLVGYTKESCIGQPQAIGNIFDDPEIQSNETLRPVTIYLKTTSVPGRRNMNDQIVRRGQKLFTDGGCVLCHRPQMRTGSADDITILDDQIFYPYTDMLLHDMGEGLADNRPEFKADGREWRTTPLWGIGLTDMINGNNYYLHDGRARTLEEAIIWHGGEAEKAKQFFITLPKSDRDALVAFLRSL